MNKLIISGAGVGKTTYIVKQALKITNQKVLITTYTESNETEIRKKIVEINGFVPNNITIQTWFSFLIKHGIKPFQGSLFEQKVNGMILVSKKSGFWFYNEKGKPVYYSEQKYFLKHYFTNDMKIYSDKLSKLVIRCNELNDNAVIDRISSIYQNIFIDEVQDLAGYDLEIIKLFLKSKSNIILVGDPRQTVYLTHNESKNSKYINGNVENFITENCKKVVCEIDKTSLRDSYRNNQQICDFSSKMYPQFPKCNSLSVYEEEHQGVYIIPHGRIQKYVDLFNPTILRNNILVSVPNTEHVFTFGNSKGLTFDRVVIFPTEPMIEWLKDNNVSMKGQSLARFYVAITRAKLSVGIVIPDDMCHSYNYSDLPIWKD